MARLYGRAPRGPRVVGWVPFWAVADRHLSGRPAVQPDRGTAGLSMAPSMVPRSAPGSSNSSLPRWTSATWWWPTISAATKLAGVLEAIEARGAGIRYLPSYSSDFNPIEQLFSKLKAIIRGLAPRSRETLFEAIGYAIEQVSPAECANYLAHAGYGRSA